MVALEMRNILFVIMLEPTFQRVLNHAKSAAFFRSLRFVLRTALAYVLFGVPPCSLGFLVELLNISQQCSLRLSVLHSTGLISQQ